MDRPAPADCALAVLLASALKAISNASRNVVLRRIVPEGKVLSAKGCGAKKNCLA